VNHVWTDEFEKLNVAVETIVSFGSC